MRPVFNRAKLRRRQYREVALERRHRRASRRYDHDWITLDLIHIQLSFFLNPFQMTGLLPGFAGSNDPVITQPHSRQQPHRGT